MDNIYVYDRDTGFILYSIDGATPQKISNLKAKKIPFIVSKRASILNQYVITANGVGVGFDAIKTQEIVLSKPVIFSDGHDEAVFTGIANGTSVSVNNEYVTNENGSIWTANSTDSSFSFSVNGFSTTNPVVRFQRYGYSKEQFQIVTMMAPTPIESMISE